MNAALTRTSLISIVFVQGCVEMPPVEEFDQKVNEAVYECSSGLQVTNEAVVEVATEIKENNGKVTASVENAIRGLLFTPELLATDNGRQAYATYVQCLKDRRLTPQASVQTISGDNSGNQVQIGSARDVNISQGTQPLDADLGGRLTPANDDLRISPALGSGEAAVVAGSSVCRIKK